MGLEYIEGDLLAAPEAVILHGCNALGAFGSGFAGIVRKKHPEAYEAYMDSHRNGGLVLGAVIWAACEGAVIGNCITQPTYGRDGRRHISYEALRACMRQVNLAASCGLPGTQFESGFGRVAMPLIGADLGGGDWNVISRIVAEELKDVSVAVYVLPGRKPSASQLRTSGPKS